MKKKTLAAIALGATAMAAAFIFGSGSHPSTLSFYSMDTPVNMTAYGLKGEKALAAARARITELEREMSVTKDSSDVSRLNAGESVALCADAEELLKTALSLSEKTGGAFDPTLYPIVRAWGFTTYDNRIPSADELEELKKLIGTDKIVSDGEKTKLAEGSMIDLGAIAKGFAGAEAAKAIAGAGVKSAVINLGGNVQTVGLPPHRKSWSVGVRAPQGDVLLGVLNVGECAIVTSGGYERYFVGDDGETYWHIMDPKTASPARSGVASATVLGSDGAECDALSTAFFVMGAQKAAEYWKAHDGFEFIILADDGLWITAGIENAFTLGREYSDMEVNVVRR